MGADAFAHDLALQLGWDVIIHPPLNARFRAYCKGASKTLKKQKYLTRNDAIAARSRIILAIPGTPFARSTRSGTWYTVERALELGKEVHICAP